MLFGGCEILGAAEIDGGVIYRFPKDVRHKLGYKWNESGRNKGQSSTGCEIRFVTDGPQARVYLTALESEGEVLVYIGDYFHSRHVLPKGVTTGVYAEVPHEFASLRERGRLPRGRFSPYLFRFVVCRGYHAMGLYSVRFDGADTFGHELKAPGAGDIPARKLLVYGSSITHGSGAVTHHNAYVQQAARRLNMDVLNKGIGGACLCEPEMADYLAGEDWDVCALEIGVNMRGLFSAEEFEGRARYLIQRMLEKGRPVFVITICPNSSALAANAADAAFAANSAFNEGLRRIVSEIGGPLLHIIEGADILDDFTALSIDLIHPSEYGHMLMGRNLARIMIERLAGAGDV